MIRRLLEATIASISNDQFGIAAFDRSIADADAMFGGFVTSNDEDGSVFAPGTMTRILYKQTIVKDTSETRIINLYILKQNSLSRQLLTFITLLIT